MNLDVVTGLNWDQIFSVLTQVLIVAVCVYGAFRLRSYSAGEIVNSLRSFNAVRGEIEEVLVEFVSGILPYLTASIPAYYTYYHLVGVLNVPPLFGFLAAATVEGLAFANVSTLLTLQTYNESEGQMKKYKSANTMPIWFNLALYLFVIISVNGLLTFVDELEKSGGLAPFMTLLLDFNVRQILIDYLRPIVVVLVITFMSFLTIPGATTVAVRTNHRQYLLRTLPKSKLKDYGFHQAEILAAEARRKQEEEENRPEAMAKIEAPAHDAPLSPVQDAIVVSQGEFDLLQLIKERRGLLANKSDAANAAGISRPTLNKYIESLEKLGVLKLNANGVAIKVDDKNVISG